MTPHLDTDNQGAFGPFGRFTGRLIVQILPDGRRMQLTEPFGFTDAAGKHWEVPAGAKVDGASIPRALWTWVGGPFEGQYRDASVIHDFYCDTRTEPWQAVHRVFYAGMRAAGVSESRAKLMYAAVYYAGPRWSDTVVDNTQLAQAGQPAAHIQSASTLPTRFEQALRQLIQTQASSSVEILTTQGHGTGNASVGTPVGSNAASAGLATALVLQLLDLKTLIEQENPDLDDIDQGIQAVMSDQHVGKAGAEGAWPERHLR